MTPFEDLFSTLQFANVHKSHSQTNENKLMKSGIQQLSIIVTRKKANPPAIKNKDEVNILPVITVTIFTRNKAPAAAIETRKM